MTSEKAVALGWTPIVRVHTAVLAGVAPMPMLHGPMPATRKAFARSGLSACDIGAYEVNEAFASVPLAWLQDRRRRGGLQTMCEGGGQANATVLELL